MFDRSREASSPRWMRAYAPLAGAALALGAAGWFTFAGIDYARSGCECNETLFPDWVWVPIFALAIAFFAGAVALIARFIARVRSCPP